jgi:hypothetical protein
MSPDSPSVPDTPGGVVVCLLVVNHIPRLPTAAVMSILHRSPARIVIGCVDRDHVRDIPLDDRIQIVDLQEHVHEGRRADTRGEYRDYGSGAFSTAVALKWRLIEHCLTHRAPDVVIYSDIDVVWLEDAAFDISAAFQVFPAAHVLCQSQQVSAAVWLPCMGFVAFRGSPRALQIVQECDRRHQQALIGAPPDAHVSDEDTLRDVREETAAGEIQDLPQAAYPVGALANLYRHEPLLPGLETPRPVIFHANFVVGIDAKLELLKRVLLELGRLDPYLGFDDD